MAHNPADITRGANAARGRRFVVALLVAVVAAGLAPAAWAQCPTSITATAPANGATGVSTQGKLEWTPQPGTSVDGFAVTFYENAGCGATGSILLGTTNVGPSFNYINYFDLAPNQTYSWKVETVKDGCAVPAVSSCQTFTTSACHSNGPSLINPEDGATADHLKTTFAWDPILGNPTGYEIFVQVNSTGAFQSFGTTSSGVFELTRDVPPGTHKWYVEGKLPGACPPARSATWSFSTSCPTTLPSLVTPSAGQAIGSPTDVTFQWSSNPGADGYDVYYKRNGGSAVKVGGTREGTAVAGTSLTATLPGTGSYSWYVVALSSGCGDLQSASSSFTVSDTCPSTGVALTAPTNAATAVSSPVTFRWDPQPNAAAAGLTGYAVYLTPTGGQPTRIATTDASTTTASYPAGTGTYTWFVSSEFANCAPVNSSTFTFTVDAPPTCPTAGPTALTPAAGATDVSSPVSFTWSPVDRASSYWVRVTRTPSGAGDSAGLTSNTSQPSLSGVVLETGDWYWGVTAVVEGCPTLIPVADRKFTISRPPTCPTTAPAPSSPLAGAPIVRQPGELVSFVWEPVANAISYTVTAGTQSTTVTDRTLVNLDVPDGTVSWTVTANYGGGCAGASSAPRQITVSAPPACILSTPTILQPANNAERLSPIVTFSWSSVPDATQYRVYRRTGTGESDRELLGVTGQTSLSKTFDLDELAFDSTNTASLEWYVEARGAVSCTRSQSARSLLKFKRTPACNTTAPLLQSPASTFTTTSREVQFTWQTTSGAVGYKLWYSLNGGAPTPLTDRPLTPDTTAATFTMPLGSSEWWVEAIFPGCPSRESAHRILTVAPPCTVRPPTILGPSPTAGTVTSPVTLSWSQVKDATSYEVFVQTATSPSQPVATITPVASNTGAMTFVYSAQPGAVTWKVRANVSNCGSAFSAESDFTVVATPPCTTPSAPTMNVQRRASSNASYTVEWTQVPNALIYEVQESSTPTFAGATMVVVTGTQTTFTRNVAIDTTYYYRVRARSSCNATVGAYSNIAEVIVQAPPRASLSFSLFLEPETSNFQSTDNNDLLASLSSLLETINSQQFVENPYRTKRAFTARGNHSWVTVTPSAGIMPEGGQMFTLYASPSGLRSGTNKASVIVDFAGTGSNAGPGNISSHATTTLTIPFNVTLVSSVTSQGKTEPPADALIIPAVAAAGGANGSRWRSDLRITNSSGEAGRYLVTFTPSGQDAGRVSNQTNVDIAAGTTMALDKVLQNWFGARDSDNVTGVIEIRSLKTGATTSARRGRQLLGSSRTYNLTAAGTYGQFIPAIPVSDFAAKGDVLTLSEVNQSATARTNLGLVEGSGQGASVRVTAFDANGVQLTTFDQYLRAGEHVQMNSFLAARGITNDNARVNVEVTSDTGRVMAYASVVDNQTNDPLLVEGQVPTSDTAWVVAGVADLDTGAARWRTDVRIHNPGATAVTASLVFYPTGNPTASKTITTTIPARGTRELKDILRNSFSLTATGGAVHVTTATATPLLVTARTYNLTTTGSYGQYIPGVPRSEAIGLNDSALQVQQLEASTAFRTNFGIAEVSGKPVKVELIAVTPDSTATQRAVVDLKANEFTQLVNVFGTTLGLTGDVFNARIAVRVIEGDGKVIAYGSVIDQRTQDPTFIPAER